MKTVTKKNTRKVAKKIGIVVSKFNDFITTKLLEGCLAELMQHGYKKDQLNIYWVPGAFEIPVVALKVAKKRDIQAVVCLGAVIRGDTIHFELVANESARGISKVSLLTGKPITLGVLATDTVDQAYKRSQDNGENKGREAAIAAVEMIETLSQINTKSSN